MRELTVMIAAMVSVAILSEDSGLSGCRGHCLWLAHVSSGFEARRSHESTDRTKLTDPKRCCVSPFWNVSGRG